MCKIAKKGVDTMKYYPQWKPGTPCDNNDAVICPDKTRCSKCGWDPEVAKKRLARLEKELKEKRRAAANG
jgi:hypothetical protein